MLPVATAGATTSYNVMLPSATAGATELQKQGRDADHNAADSTTVITQLADFAQLELIYGKLSRSSHLAFALVCRRFRDVHGKRPMRTPVAAVVETEALRRWAASLGCPSPYPHWAELRGLLAAHLNGRVALVLGPPFPSGRQPVDLGAALRFDPQRAIGDVQSSHKIKVKPENIRPFSSEELGVVRVLKLDAMLPKQVLRFPRSGHLGNTFERLQQAAQMDLRRESAISASPSRLIKRPRLEVSSPRLGVVGGVRGEHGLCLSGVEIHISSAGPNETVSVVGGRPFRILERLEAQARGVGDVLDVFESVAGPGHVLARVRWEDYEGAVEPPACDPKLQVPLERQPATLFPSSAHRRDAEELLPLVEIWKSAISGSEHERAPGQLASVLRDLGPMPRASSPGELALYVAALINPLPALGVAPECRANTLRAACIGERLRLVRDALGQSLQTLGVPLSLTPHREWAVIRPLAAAPAPARERRSEQIKAHCRV